MAVITFPIDIGDQCTACGESTAFGSGRYVNRVPSGTEFFNGWMCTDCNTPDEEDMCTCENCEGCEELRDYERDDNMCAWCGERHADSEAYDTAHPWEAE